MVASGNKVIRGKVEIVPIIDKITLDTVFRINYKDTVVFRSKYTVVYKITDGKTVTESTSGIEVDQRQEDGSWLFIVNHHYGGADFAEFQELNKTK